MNFLQQPVRNVFFTGKGGVGKTSIACATAVRLADAGRRVLLVSTDPASNLEEVLGTTLGTEPTGVPRVPRLRAMNLDPEQAAAAYRERMVGPYRGLLPAAAITSMEEQFSGACTVEIAAFDVFARLIGNDDARQDIDHVVFDTAPTGHTLRLLSLPSAWSGFLQSNTTGTSCLGPLAGLQEQQALYQSAVRSLGDPARTQVVLVTRPEKSALREAARTRDELAALGIRNLHLVVNGVFRAADPQDLVAMALQRRAEQALDEIPPSLAGLARTTIPLAASGILGVTALRGFGADVAGPNSLADISADRDPLPPAFATLLEDLAAPGHGVILAMGKGGVGKTTVAAAVARALADRGHRVHLTTTDPAAHVALVAGAGTDRLTVSRIDAAAETARYAREVLQAAGPGLDAAGRAVLEEDLRSPCTEEIAVFRAFAEAVADGDRQFVVLDTAPTGHTILLLDAALAYHRDVSRQSSHVPDAVRQLLPRLRDPMFTRILIVTLPEATPVHEAAALQRDLRRAELQPWAWVINQSLLPLPVTDPVLKARQQQERPYVREVVEQLAGRAVLIPWQAEPPVGSAALRHLCEQTLLKDAE